MTWFRFINRITLIALVCGWFLATVCAQGQPWLDPNAHTAAQHGTISSDGTPTQSGDANAKGVSENPIRHQSSSNRSDSKSVADYALVPLSGFVQLSEGKSGKSTESSAATWSTITKAVAWPMVTLILVWRLLKEPQIKDALAKISRRVTQFKVAGLEIQLSEGAVATLDELQKLIAQVPETNKDWLSNTHLGAQFRLVVSDIQKCLRIVDTNFTFALDDGDLAQFRFTLHVQDVLLTHSFRQLVDYIGHERGGSGRIFSSRRGIVGLAWRLEESIFESTAFSEQDLVFEVGDDAC